MRKTPAGQRPRISQNKSAGWSWLRLLPIHEQQARASLESHSSGGSPDTHSMHQNNEQNHSPEGMTEKLHTKAAPAHAPATNAEGNAPEAKSAAATVTFDHRPSNKGEGSVSGSAPEATTTGATEAVDHQPSSEADGSVSPISEPDFQPPETKGSSRSPSAVHFSASDVSDAGDRPHAEPITTSKTDSHETKEQSLDSKEDRLLPSLPDEPVNEIEAAEQQPEANVGLRRGTISSVTTTTGSSSKDDLRSQPEIAHAIDSGSSAKDQPDAGTGTRRGTNSSVTSVLKDQGGIGDLCNEEVPATSDPQGVSLQKEEPASPSTTRSLPVNARVFVPNDSIPYYATPKIMVHRPSQSSQSDRSGLRTIDEVLAKERAAPTIEQRLQNTEHEQDPVPSVVPRLIDTPTGKGVHKIVKVKKRSLFVRKARNLAARKTILKMTLGRQLAAPTKQALRQLAHGETIIDEPFEVS